MSCEDFKALLDAYIDDECSEAELAALSEHAKACEACSEEFRAAQLLKETLAHMDDEIVVPLQAQAAWRSAVRAEAQKNKKAAMRKWLRAGSAVAAALVLALGLSLTAGNAPDDRAPLQTAMLQERARGAVVASDGASVAAYSGEAGAYTLRWKLGVSSVQDALQKIQMLAEEYSGGAAAQDESACIVELPSDYLQDFLKAAGSIGEELSSETIGEAGERAIILIQLVQE